MSDLHTGSIEAGFGDDFAGLEWPYNHNYIQFMLMVTTLLFHMTRTACMTRYHLRCFYVLKIYN